MRGELRDAVTSIEEQAVRDRARQKIAAQAARRPITRSPTSAWAMLEAAIARPARWRYLGTRRRLTDDTRELLRGRDRAGDCASAGS
ncbi:MAG: hypothetical protein V9E89_03640 [Ilumatobacteraceae bacterium]